MNGRAGQAQTLLESVGLLEGSAAGLRWSPRKELGGEGTDG